MVKLVRLGGSVHDSQDKGMLWCRCSGLAWVGFTGRFNLMLVPHMGTKVILSFDSPIPDSLASWDWAIEALLEMLHLIVTG